MGTAVLLPHDCLRNSKNRHKGHLSEAIFHSVKASRVRRGTFQASVASDPSMVCSDLSRKNTLSGRTEWTPKSTTTLFHDHGSDSLQLQKEFERRKPRGGSSIEMKETKSAVNSTGNAPVFTILQRPKSKEAADELIAKFMIQVKGEKVVDGQLKQKQEFSQIPNVTNLSVGKPKSSIPPKSSEMRPCNYRKGGCITTAEESKVLESNSSVTNLADKAKSYISEADLVAGKGQSRSVASSAAQPIIVPRRENQRVFDDVLQLRGLRQVASLKAISEHENVKKTCVMESTRSKHFHQTQPTIPGSTVPGGLPRLKRSSTDPQGVKQLAGHYRTEVVDIPCREAKSCYGFIRTGSMSCPERWAGPAYYSSPAPSSLPLPTFSCRNQRLPSFESSGDGHTNNTWESPYSESIPPQGDALDVAFATKSLRRMLKLDPF